MLAYLCDAWETDTPFVYSGNTKSGDEMLPTVDYLDISVFNLTILRQGVMMNSYIILNNLFVYFNLCGLVFDINTFMAPCLSIKYALTIP